MIRTLLVMIVSAPGADSRTPDPGSRPPDFVRDPAKLHFHRPDCPFIKGVQVVAADPNQVAVEGIPAWRGSARPCPMCCRDLLPEAYPSGIDPLGPALDIEPGDPLPTTKREPKTSRRPKAAAAPETGPPGPGSRSHGIRGQLVPAVIRVTPATVYRRGQVHRRGY
jgi:hypothetical protein